MARLVVDRKTNPQIAAELFLSQKTVETHLRNIFRKIDVSTRVELAHVVEHAGLGASAPSALAALGCGHLRPGSSAALEIRVRDQGEAPMSRRRRQPQSGHVIEGKKSRQDRALAARGTEEVADDVRGRWRD